MKNYVFEEIAKIKAANDKKLMSNDLHLGSKKSGLSTRPQPPFLLNIAMLKTRFLSTVWKFKVAGNKNLMLLKHKTEAKLNFGTYFNFSVKIKDKK